MDNECSVCKDLWRQFARIARKQAELDKGLRNAARQQEHDAIKSLLSAAAVAAQQRTAIRTEIEKHECEAHPADGSSDGKGAPAEPGVPPPVDPPAPGRALEDIERLHIERIFLEAEHNLSMAARILKIDRTTLYSKLRKYGLK